MEDNSTPPDFIRRVDSNLFLLDRLKAFITDVFMIYTPILYIAYIVLGSKEAFQGNQLVIFICFLLYLIITSIFFCISGQTPGFRYVKLKLSGIDGKNICFTRALLRSLLFCISMSFLFGFIFPFLNKRRIAFHDLISKTRIYKQD